MAARRTVLSIAITLGMLAGATAALAQTEDDGLTAPAVVDGIVTSFSFEAEGQTSGPGEAGLSVTEGVRRSSVWEAGGPRSQRACPTVHDRAVAAEW
jgi:hypothetical protein